MEVKVKLQINYQDHTGWHTLMSSSNRYNLAERIKKAGIDLKQNEVMFRVVKEQITEISLE